MVFLCAAFDVLLKHCFLFFSDDFGANKPFL